MVHPEEGLFGVTPLQSSGQSGSKKIKHVSKINPPLLPLFITDQDSPRHPEFLFFRSFGDRCYPSHLEGGDFLTFWEGACSSPFLFKC